MEISVAHPSSVIFAEGPPQDFRKSLIPIKVVSGPRVASEPGMKVTDYAKAFETGFPATRRFLLSRGAAVEEAEEIAQAAWVRGWEFRDQLRDPGLVGFWVNSIARNLFRARFRARLTMPMDGVEAPYSMNLEEIELRRLLERCSGRDRRLLEQSLEGYSAEEIAQTEGITSTGIRVRLLRIRQSLRNQLALAPA
jgi:DNA-directed RNA polymerase specialized sigma24 family protein